ncbi:MAG: hypothetical protein EHM48_10010, partial [Planctomycetaceae bacterium]
GLTSDALQPDAQNAARAAVAAADAILFVVDTTCERADEDLALLREVRKVNADCPLAILANKTDLLDAAVRASRVKSLADRFAADVLAVSAGSGEGLGELAGKLADMLHLSAGRSGYALGLHQRQKRCLRHAAIAADAAGKVLAGATQIADVAELAAIELRAALEQLGQISGQVVTENILGRIFARFCVGK